jgi:hypothetical protein
MKPKGNPIARSPLLRKGGPHQRAVSGERARARQALRRQVDACLDPTTKLIGRPSSAPH